MLEYKKGFPSKGCVRIDVGFAYRTKEDILALLLKTRKVTVGYEKRNLSNAKYICWNPSDIWLPATTSVGTYEVDLLFRYSDPEDINQTIKTNKEDDKICEVRNENKEEVRRTIRVGVHRSYDNRRIRTSASRCIGRTRQDSEHEERLRLEPKCYSF